MGRRSASRGILVEPSRSLYLLPCPAERCQATGRSLSGSCRPSPTGNKAEKAQLQEKISVARAVSFLKDIGYLDERFIAFHGVCLDEEDIHIFAGQGCKVIHNLKAT